jgi:hypothetical protein
MAKGSSSAWTNKATGSFGDIVKTAIVTHSNTATSSYTPTFQVPVGKDSSRRITIAVEPTVISGTNIDVALCGCDSPSDTPDTGSFFVLLDAPVVDLTNGVGQVGVVDLGDYPSPYYFLSFLTDTDESALSHRSTVRVFIPRTQA